MNDAARRCTITYERLAPGERYSRAGLKRLSPVLEGLQDLPFTAVELRREAFLRATKMSIQGVQPKLSVVLNPSERRFDLVDRGGRYILKPPHEAYPELPENEDLSMRLAERAGIEVPLHGLIYARDGTRTYFIRRFDRGARGQKTAVEDFAQLSGENRETKYNSSMEKVAGVLDRFSTFPLLDKRELFLRTLFNFLIGNEDMHLKNFSLIMRDGKVEMAPAYDFLNSAIAVRKSAEELALPLRGKKARLRRSELVDYFGSERLGLNRVTIDETLHRLARVIPQWETLIRDSFLTAGMAESYFSLLKKRRMVLEL